MSPGRRIVAADRFDRVAAEFQSHRLAFARREDVEDAAAKREFTVLVRRIFTGEASVDQQLGQIGRRDLLPGFEIDRRAQQTLGGRHTRQQRGRRGDNDAGGAGGDGVQRPGTGRRDADVRREAAIRVDLVRREWQHRPIRSLRREPLEGGDEEADVADAFLELGVGRHRVEEGAVR
jgi:hypothetical protein